MHKLHADLRSQGFAIAKDSVHALEDHLEASFLLRLVPLASESLRQRQSNPRKVYPIDPGLIGLFDRRGQRQLGQRLETVVALELLRRGCELGYGLTADRQELDFVARHGDGTVQLVQVCADPNDPVTLARELRPLAAAMKLYGATAVDLVVLHPPSSLVDLPVGVRLRPAVEWLLDGGAAL
ncbi:MAG: DUF4143 domain-containing protein [Prochlorococcaceae cyanobacterium]